MKTIYIACALLLLAATASAQAPVAVTINPNEACFNAPDFTAVDPGGTIVTAIRLEIWNPGDDTTARGPVKTSGDIAKSSAVAVASDPATPTLPRYCLSSSTWGFTIDHGPTYLATILVKGDGGASPRSAFSNPFSFPLPVRAPLPVTGFRVDVAPSAATPGK